MQKKELTKELLPELRNLGYRSLIAKGSPEKDGDLYIQTLLASKQEVHKEETAEAGWQVSIDDESFLENSNLKYVVETE